MEETGIYVFKFKLIEFKHIYYEQNNNYKMVDWTIRCLAIEI